MSCFQTWKFILIALCFINHKATFAAESDNFTQRELISKLADSSEQLNSFVNEKLKQVEQSLLFKDHCNSRELYLAVRNAIGQNPISQSEKYVEMETNFPKILVPFKDSIYGTVPTFLSRMRMPTAADMFFISGWMSSTIKLAGIIVGTDKLGHFFGQGWDYYHQGNLSAALNVGIKDEQGMYGTMGSGIYSYADLSANLDGLKFWKQLDSGTTPYFLCQGNAYRLVKEFNWKHYVTPAWDEALNCSSYEDSESKNAIESQIQKRGGQCPIQPTICSLLVEQPCSAVTVNPICFKITAISLNSKMQECILLQKQENWTSIESHNGKNKLTDWDHTKIQMETMLGISTMSAHYIKRELKKKGWP